MSTSCVIEFRYRDESYKLWRGHDAIPEVVGSDLDEAISEYQERRFGYPEVGQLTALFMALHNDWRKRIMKYEPIQRVPGDACYFYAVFFDGGWKWEAKSGMTACNACEHCRGCPARCACDPTIKACPNCQRRRSETASWSAKRYSVDCST